MLPKPEKNKNLKNAQQLDLVNSISSEEKLSHKRHFVITFLVLTVGISFLFWGYRSIKNIIVNHDFPNLNISLPLPSKSSQTVTLPSLDSKIKTILGNQENWAISVSLVNSPEEFSWQYDPQNTIQSLNPSLILDNLSDTPASSQGLIAQALPPGARVQEITQKEENAFSSQALITVPKKQIFLFIKTTNLSGQSNYEDTLKLIAEEIYWHILNLPN